MTLPDTYQPSILKPKMPEPPADLSAVRYLMGVAVNGGSAGLIAGPTESLAEMLELVPDVIDLRARGLKENERFAIFRHDGQRDVVLYTWDMMHRQWVKRADSSPAAKPTLQPKPPAEPEPAEPVVAQEPEPIDPPEPGEPKVHDE